MPFRQPLRAPQARRRLTAGRVALTWRLTHTRGGNHGMTTILPYGADRLCGWIFPPTPWLPNAASPRGRRSPSRRHAIAQRSTLRSSTLRCGKARCPATRSFWPSAKRCRMRPKSSGRLSSAAWQPARRPRTSRCSKAALPHWPRLAVRCLRACRNRSNVSFTIRSIAISCATWLRRPRASRSTSIAPCPRPTWCCRSAVCGRKTRWPTTARWRESFRPFRMPKPSSAIARPWPANRASSFAGSAAKSKRSAGCWGCII